MFSPSIAFSFSLCVGPKMSSAPPPPEPMKLYGFGGGFLIGGLFPVCSHSSHLNIYPAQHNIGSVTSIADTTNFYGLCTQVDQYEKINRIGEGTYGIVCEFLHWWWSGGCTACWFFS